MKPVAGVFIVLTVVQLTHRSAAILQRAEFVALALPMAIG